MFNKALVETVLDSYVFSNSDEWWTIDGGLSHLIDGMVESLSLKFPRLRTGFQVSKLTQQASDGRIVVIAKNRAQFLYDHVISTIPFGVLHSSVDTSSLNFDLKKRMGIRLLNVEPSVKISIKFRTRWWQDPVKMKNKPIKGGQTYTDLPLRRIVYPSYGLNCSEV